MGGGAQSVGDTQMRLSAAHHVRTETDGHVRVITLDAIYVNATFNLKRSSIHGTTVLLLHEVELLAAGDAYGVWFIAEVLAPEQLAIAWIIDRSHEGNVYGIMPAASQ